MVFDRLFVERAVFVALVMGFWLFEVVAAVKEDAFGDFLDFLVAVDLEDLRVLVDFKDIEVYCLSNLWAFRCHSPFLTMPITTTTADTILI